MIPELGHFLLIIAAMTALLAPAVVFYGIRRGDDFYAGFSRPASLLTALMLTLSTAALVWAFLTDDFSVAYVANHSNTKLAPAYKAAALWGSHEGSMLLWIWLMAVGTAGAGFVRCADRLFTSRLQGLMLAVLAGFCAFLLFTSNPFLRNLPMVPPDGRDLNPILQDIGMILHPPVLFMGYAGLALMFAAMCALLLSGRWSKTAIDFTTRLSIVTWGFLTAGNMLGSWWAYNELGWGGWWFWDPVENSSFMPWLTGTALIHSLAVTEKRGCFRIWTVLLAILTFSLSLLGTFLVRSGVLTSVHAFATDPERGLFILAFLIIVIGLSFLLFAWRAPTVGLGGNFSLISRESMLLVNNVLLVVAMGAVLLGTLYPLFLDALNAGKISVGPPYFDAVFGPLMLPCVFLMGVGPLARWKDADPKALARELAWCLVAAIVAGAAIPLLMGEFGHWVFLGCTSAMFVFFAVIQTFRHQIRNQPGNVFARLMRQPRAFWGMQLAHIGVAVFIIGVALVKGYQSERDVRMYEGETVTVAGYTFTFNGVETVRGPNYTADRGDFTLSVNGRELQHLYPEKRKYYSSNSMPMTESAIRHSITGDVYVSLGTPTNDGGWVVRAYYKPYVTWIWWGCIIMAAAGLWAASDRRYRRRKQKNEADGE